MMKAEKLNLVTECDKVYPRNEKVNHKKVTFVNHFSITLAFYAGWPKTWAVFNLAKEVYGEGGEA